jgi:hypothetical protein
MADQVRVFVSHHHSPEEDAFTARLVADLEAAGADVWVDTAGITSDDFIKKINEGLTGRQWLVLVMTPQLLASRWVQEEVVPRVKLPKATWRRHLTGDDACNLHVFEVPSNPSVPSSASSWLSRLWRSS